MGLVSDAWNAFKKYTPGGRVAGYLFDPAKGDTKPAQDASTQAKDMVTGLGQERSSFQATPPPMVTATSIEPTQVLESRSGPDHFGSTPGRVVPVTDPKLNPLGAARDQQNEAIGLLRDAAFGNTPSAAELASKAAADRAASQQFGQAAALQGALSPGAALRQASEGSAAILGQNATDLGTLRAKETSDARNALVSAVGNLRGQEQDLSTTTAKMKLEADMANQRAVLQARGLDNQQINALLQAQLEALGIDAGLAKAIVDANFKNAAADNAGGAALVDLGEKVATHGAK